MLPARMMDPSTPDKPLQGTSALLFLTKRFWGLVSWVFFNLLLHGNKAGVREMCKHTLIPSTSLSAQLNQSHKNTLCTSNTCRRLKLSTVCQQKETLEAGQHARLS